MLLGPFLLASRCYMTRFEYQTFTENISTNFNHCHNKFQSLPFYHEMYLSYQCNVVIFFYGHEPIFGHRRCILYYWFVILITLRIAYI